MNKTMISGTMICCLFLTFACSRHAQSGGHHWSAPREAAGRENPVPGDAHSIKRGGKIFMEYCMDCHGADARGNGPDAEGLDPSPPDLTLMGGTHPEGDMAWKIANGKDPMPAWKHILSQGQIWDLVNFIKSKADHKH